MTGLYNRIELLVIFACVLLFYIPAITVLLMNQIGCYKGFRGNLRILLLVSTYLVTAALTLLIIRSAPYRAPDWIFLFGMIMTVLFLIVRIRHRKQKQSAGASHPNSI